MKKLEVSGVLAQKVWDQLNKTAVPIVEAQDFFNLKETIGNLNDRISTNQYFPDNVHGYFGINKRYGVTRFIPIINHTDMALYYQVCGEIGDRVIKNKEGIFGGWRVVPTPATLGNLNGLSREEQVELLYENEYFSETFSSAAWFQNYKSFTDCIRELTLSGEYGNYVGMTDIANFYDTIDIDRLISKIRDEVPDLIRHTEVLEVYLRYWNRRLMGYQKSNKGIPQEIITDGSRNLSHFYLQSFDDAIKKYCKSIGVKYVRWADDMLFFSPSPQRIESCFYEASRILLSDGLNLSAPKTTIISRLEFRKYRCLPLLKSIDEKDDDEFNRQVELLRNAEKRGERVKHDTAIKAVLTHLRRNKHLRNKINLKYIEDGFKKHPEVFSSLNDRQLLASIVIFDDPSSRAEDVKNMINRKSMAGPKAYFLKLIREHSTLLRLSGVKKEQMSAMVDEIKKSSSDSYILQKFCIPGALYRLNLLHAKAPM
uniref:Putative retron type reverse transcriptase n=1 Tax=Paracoccus marcusii TaxID=59779 RepID=I2ECB4_9RHOB|nr:RNA-directed DNA polymerase [Paracoccus marcusii]AFJ97311.1 putative retron type reverse transcriptase [Paracoccus marcusii]